MRGYCGRGDAPVLEAKPAKLWRASRIDNSTIRGPRPMLQEQIALAQQPILAGFGDLPPWELGDSRYAVRYARTANELDAVLALRFEVFNLELGEGLALSYETGRDEDEFDAVCRHLMVVERASGRVVGTYRLQTSAIAAAARGFYSATEFDLFTLPTEVLEDA